MAEAMDTSKLRRFIRKYDFPAHLFVLFDIVFGHVSILFWTMWTKTVLRALGCRSGKNLRVDGRVIVRVARRGAIRIGDNVTINSRTGSNLVGRTNPVIFQRLGENARRATRDRHGTEKVAAETVAVYKEILRLTEGIA